ncbi:MAG TPA: protelomerase family protein [Stenomitos sp.]
MATKLSRLVDETVRTAWVKTWTENFLKGLQPLKSKEKIEGYCVEQKAAFETEVKRLSHERARQQKKEVSQVSWLNAAATHMSQIRNAIKSWQQTINLSELNSYPQKTKDGIVSQHYALLYMNYSKEDHELRMQPTKERKDEQRRNLEPINCLDIYQETIESLLESHDYRELTVGLIAATGRRPSEILSTAVFTQKSQFEVNFEGQLKAKGERDEYPTFTLVESAKVVDGLLKLRRMPEIKEMKQWELFEIDSGKNSTVNSKVKEFFASLINPPRGEKELSNKNLRAAYAAIAIYLFCPGNHSESLFIKERLGHTGDATASNYEDYQVVDINGKQLPRGAWVERINEEMSKPMQVETKPQLRMTAAAKEVINDQEFLLYPDQLSRIEELIRLARIGKAYEEGKLVKEVVKVVEVVKEVEKPVEVIKEVVKEVERMVEKPLEVIREVKRQLEGVEQVEEVKAVEEVKSVAATRFEEMSNEELRGCQAPGSALEKIRRSVRTIKIYNEQQAEKKAQWAINVSTLEDLSGCHSKAVREYLDSDEGRLQVTDYNLEKGFGFQQNRGKGSIKQYVTW